VAQPTLVAQQQEPAAAPAPVQAVPTAQPVMEKLPA
jgi:hypothetical protein